MFVTWFQFPLSYLIMMDTEGCQRDRKEQCPRVRSLAVSNAGVLANWRASASLPPVVNGEVRPCFHTAPKCQPVAPEAIE